MFKKYFIDKINLIEGTIIIFSLFWYLINKGLDKPVTPEFIINTTIMVLFLSLIFFKNGNIRYMFFGFVLLILTLISSLFGYNQFVYLISSLALGLFVLGFVNMLLFMQDTKGD